MVTLFLRKCLHMNMINDNMRMIVCLNAMQPSGGTFVVSQEKTCDKSRTVTAQ